MKEYISILVLDHPHYLKDVPLYVLQGGDERVNNVV